MKTETQIKIPNDFYITYYADKHKKIMIAGKKLPWRIEDFRNADYFVNKGYTVWTFTHDPIEDEE